MTNKEFFILQLEKEMKRTLNAVKALKDDMSLLDFKPDARSRSALKIIAHILPHNEAMFYAIESKDILEEDNDFSSMSEAYEYHEQWTKKLMARLRSVPDDAWDNEMISLSVPGKKNIYSGTMRDMFWTLMFDTIHHRGQLSTYYRQMGLRPPSLYGPTAEDEEERLVAAKAKQN